MHGKGSNSTCTHQGKYDMLGIQKGLQDSTVRSSADRILTNRYMQIHCAASTETWTSCPIIWNNLSIMLVQSKSMGKNKSTVQTRQPCNAKWPTCIYSPDPKARGIGVSAAVSAPMIMDWHVRLAVKLTKEKAASSCTPKIRPTAEAVCGKMRRTQKLTATAGSEM